MKMWITIIILTFPLTQANSKIRTVKSEDIEDLQIQKPYATIDNFTGNVIYPSDDFALVHDCQLEEKVISKLKIAQIYLKKVAPELHFLAFDCYRPIYAQNLLWEASDCNNPTKNCIGFIAPPGKSKHNLGRALDITLASQDGHQIQMPTEYDSFTDKAMPKNYKLWEPLSKKNWLILYRSMSAGGCKVISTEWWHYDC